MGRLQSRGIIMIICLSLYACRETLIWRYGIHTPRKESAASIRRFLARQKIPAENIFLFRDTAAFLHFLKDTVFRRNLFRPMIYSGQGLLGPVGNTDNCLQETGSLVWPLNKEALCHADTAHSFTSLLSSVISLDREQTSDTDGADFVAVVTWATFLGRFNRNLFSLCKELTEQQGMHVMPVFLSMDMLEGWKLRRNQRLHFRSD